MVVKSHIQGIVPADIQGDFIKVARWKAFMNNKPQKGAISDALAEAIVLWLKLNARYKKSLDDFEAYEKGQMTLKEAISRD